LQGFPSAYRPIFESMVGEAQLREFTENLPPGELPEAFRLQ